MPAGKMTAYQAFANSRSAIPAIVAATDAALKNGLVMGVTKDSLAKNKNKNFAEFVKKYNIPIVEGGARGGGSRGGVATTSLALAKGDTNHPIVKIANQYIETGKALQKELEKFNRSLSPGYIRAENKPEPKEAEAKTPAAAGK